MDDSVVMVGKVSPLTQSLSQSLAGTADMHNYCDISVYHHLLKQPLIQCDRHSFCHDSCWLMSEPDKADDAQEDEA